MLTAFDCFSGADGFRVLTEPQGISFIGFCEKDKYATKLYNAYYKTEGEYYCDDSKPGLQPHWQPATEVNL